MVLGLYRAAQYGEFFTTSEFQENRSGVFRPTQTATWVANVMETGLRSPDGGDLSPLGLTTPPVSKNKLRIFQQSSSFGRFRPLQGVSGSVYNTRYRFALELLANPYGSSNLRKSHVFGVAQQVGHKVARLGFLGRYVQEVLGRAASSNAELGAARRAVGPILQTIGQQEVVACQKQYFRVGGPLGGEVRDSRLFIFRGRLRRGATQRGGRSFLRYGLTGTSMAPYLKNNAIKYSTDLYFRHSAHHKAFPAFFYMNHHTYYLAQRKI